MQVELRMSGNGRMEKFEEKPVEEFLSLKKFVEGFTSRLIKEKEHPFFFFTKVIRGEFGEMDADKLAVRVSAADHLAKFLHPIPYPGDH